MINQSEWKWYGNAGHFICGHLCRFHLTTEVGRYLVSTVGEYISPMTNEVDEVGCGRKYETMVFKVIDHRDCGCPDVEFAELDCRGYNNHQDATRGHIAVCRKWETKDAVAN